MAKMKKATAEQLGKQVERIEAKIAELEKSRDEIEMQIDEKKAELESTTNAWKARLWDDYQAGLNKESGASGDTCGDENALEKSDESAML